MLMREADAIILYWLKVNKGSIGMSQGYAHGLWYLRGPQTGHQQCLLLFIQTREVANLQNLVSQKHFYKTNILTQYVVRNQWSNSSVLSQEHIFGYMPPYQWSSWMKYSGEIFSHATDLNCSQNLSEFRFAWVTYNLHVKSMRTIKL